MIQINLGEGQHLVAGSNWDSGRHLSFYCGRVTEGEYTGVGLDKLLTREQIDSIETTIAVLVKGYISEDK